MRYIEYIWLAAAVSLTIFFAISIKEMTTTNMAGFLVGIVLASFMYAFRRRQRKIQEARDLEEERALEESLKDEEDAAN